MSEPTTEKNFERKPDGGAAHGWETVTESNLPPFQEIVWLWNGKKIWIGGRADDNDGWLLGNCYGQIWQKENLWCGEIETDDDYQPTHWMRLPQSPNGALCGGDEPPQTLKTKKS